MKSTVITGNLILHLHPKRVNKASLKFTYTWGLGGMATVLIILQVFTGFLLRFHYDPSPAGAYDSIIMIQEGLVYGTFIRNLHHWAGMLLVIIVFLHLVRVIYTSAFLYPRRMNWLIGIGLLFCTLLFNFSGYLLPWDQRSFWAVTVGTNMLEYLPLIGSPIQHLVRGGTEVTGTTLLNFYSFHTGFLPILTVVLMVYHFWKIRKARGLAISGFNGNTETTDTIPNLVIRELIVALVLMAALFVGSLLFNAPLLEKANPAFSPNPAKAPWYFLGIQELMLHFHPFVSIFFIPVIMVMGLIIVPFLKFPEQKPGIWFFGSFGLSLVIKTLIFTILFIVSAVLAGEFLIDFGAWLNNMAPMLSEGFIPLLIILLPVLVWFIYLKKRYRPAKPEMIMALFTFIIVGYLILMFTNIWFRGPGMILMWPWQL